MWEPTRRPGRSSRDRSRLALVAPQSGVLVVDARTLRALRRLTGPRYRFGPELDLGRRLDGPWARRDCLLPLRAPGRRIRVDRLARLARRRRRSEVDLGEPAVLTWERTRTGLAVLAEYGADPTTLDVDLLDAWGSDEVRLEVTSPHAPALAVDVARNRLFVLAPGGVIAEIAGSTTGRPKTVSYHAVEYLPIAPEQPLRRGRPGLAPTHSHTGGERSTGVTRSRGAGDRRHEHLDRTRPRPDGRGCRRRTGLDHRLAPRCSGHHRLR